jgi:hypothetical protein
MDGECEFWRGEHDGYQRLGVTHRRTIERRGDVWNVRDDVVGNGQHAVRLHWLLQDFSALVDDSAGTVQLTTPKGSVHIRAKCATDADFTLVRAGQKIAGNVAVPDESARGWVSTTYASKQPALSLALEANCKLPIAFETVFEFAENGPNHLRAEAGLAEVNE